MVVHNRLLIYFLSSSIHSTSSSASPMFQWLPHLCRVHGQHDLGLASGIGLETWSVPTIVFMVILTCRWDETVQERVFRDGE